MVLFSPYHIFQISNAIGSDPPTGKPIIADKIVQEIHTYTVIPMVSINWVTHEWTLKGQLMCAARS